MKFFLITIFTVLIANISVADYDFENVYRFDNIDMVKNNDGSNIVNMTVNGFSKDSYLNQDEALSTLGFRLSMPCIGAKCGGEETNSGNDFKSNKTKWHD